MRKLLCLAAAVLCLSSCYDDVGLIVNPPKSLTVQWYSTENVDGEEFLLLWDFTAEKNCVYFAEYTDLSTLKTFPQYYLHRQYLYPYVCHKKGDTYIITLDDGYDSTYYFTDITPVSAHVASLDGYENDLTICRIKVTPVEY